MMLQHRPIETASVAKILFSFLAIFSASQLTWMMVRENLIGQWLRGTLIVEPASYLINVMTPAVHAYALGNQIKAPGGGVVVKLGCEGVEVGFLLIAAFFSLPMSRSIKYLGLMIGLCMIYILNQLRIISLFYMFRLDTSLFYFFHTTVWPLLIVFCTGLFFYIWLRKHDVFAFGK